MSAAEFWQWAAFYDIEADESAADQEEVAGGRVG